MGTRILVDTNTGIDFLASKLPAAPTAWLEHHLNTQKIGLSVIVRIELLPWQGSTSAMQLLLDFIAEAEQFSLDEPVIQQTIRLRQQHRIKLPDAIIAATALAHDLPLLTRNLGDFWVIPGLTIIDPHDAAAMLAFQNS